MHDGVVVRRHVLGQPDGVPVHFHHAVDLDLDLHLAVDAYVAFGVGTVDVIGVDLVADVPADQRAFAVRTYGRKYIGFGILNVLDAWPPLRSLYWSPKLATIW